MKRKDKRFSECQQGLGGGIGTGLFHTCMYEIRGHGACRVQHDPHVCNHYGGAHTTLHHQRSAVFVHADDVAACTDPRETGVRASDTEAFCKQGVPLHRRACCAIDQPSSPLTLPFIASQTRACSWQRRNGGPKLYYAHSGVISDCGSNNDKSNQ